MGAKVPTPLTRKVFGMSQEWVNVKDKLPRDGEWVRVWSPYDKGECLGRICGDGMQNWFVIPRHDISFKSNKAVTHWQPFGDPPKPEGPFNFTDDAIEYTENGKVVAVLNVLAPVGWAMKDVIEWVNEVLVPTN